MILTTATGVRGDDTDNGVTTEISSTVNSVPEGVLIHVLPSINLDDRTVSLAVRPTITEVVMKRFFMTRV